MMTWMNMVITPIPGNLTVSQQAILRENKLRILKRKKGKNSCDVIVANGDKITPQAEGIVPFNVPTAAVDVAVYSKTC